MEEMEYKLRSCLLTYDQEINLIKKKYEGSPTAEDILSHFEAIRNMDLPKKVRLLEDYRNASLGNIKTHELGVIADAIKNEVRNYSSVRMAFLHTKPNDQILSTLVSERTKNIARFESRVFTTSEAAEFWLAR